MKAVISWSSGKDAAHALHLVLRDELAEVAGLVTSINEAQDRVAMHGVRRALLEAQIERLGLPPTIVGLPPHCPNAVYEERMGAALAELRERGVTHVILGDIHLADVRAYREAQLAGAGLEGLFPLWGRESAELAREMIATGLKARLTCLDPARLAADFAGRAYDAALLEALPADVDACGENGEFHTLVTGGPLFPRPLEVVQAETVSRDGFVFTDVRPAPKG